MLTFASLWLMKPVLIEYSQTGFVSRMPTWITALVLAMVACMTFTAGLILDTVARLRVEQLRIRYISIKGIGVSREIGRRLLVNVA